MDATKEDGSFGRLINHSVKKANIEMKVMTLTGKPQVVFVASTLIDPGSEILYDYGERRQEVIAANKWLLQ